MKKLFFIISVMFISVTPSFAAFTIDAFGVYVGSGDMKNQTGFGGGFGYGITETLSLEYRMIFTEKTLHANTWNEVTYENEIFLFGACFVPKIPVLEQYQLSWNTSLYGGIIKSRFGGSSTMDYDDDGYAISLWTGPHFNLTQYISFYAEFGYNYNIFSSAFKDKSIQGLQALIGARCSLFGVKDYADGY